MRGLPPAALARLLRRFELVADEEPGVYSTRLAYAQVLLAAGRWSEAALQFEKAAALSPLAVAPRTGRARAFRRQGDLRGAVTELRAALRLSAVGGGALAIARVLVADAIASGDLEAEVEARRVLVGVRPGNRATLDLASALNRMGRPADAADVLASATHADAGGVAATTLVVAEGRYRAAAGDLDRAAAVLQRARRLAPLQSRALREEIWSFAIEVARRRGSLDALKDELAHPRDGVEWAARARISDEKGDLRDAWAAFDEAIRRAPGDPGLRSRRLAVAKRVATPDELATLYESLPAHGGTAGGGVNAAMAAEALDGLWSMGRAEAAGRLFDKLVKNSFGRAGTLRALAEIAGRWGDDRRAERTWNALLRRDPHNEMAIIAMGEVRFQRGQRPAAVETWRRLLRGGASSGERHARLAEILFDHDLYEPALLEARAALKLSAGQPRHHRLVATILERQPRTRDAEAAWEAVLRSARGPSGASERREARSRLIALWIREGNARVEARMRELEVALRRDLDNREALTFLVEAQLRTGRTEAATSLLKSVLAQTAPGGEPRGKGAGDDDSPLAASSSDGELILLLVRTLRQLQRTSEAVWWLEELARRYPNSARDASLQLADIATAGHADERARNFAEQAVSAAPDDPRVAMRVATVRERLGQLDEALTVYRRLVSTTRDPAATLAMATLLGRMGEVDEQRSLLREAIRGGADDEVVVEAGRRALVLEEAAGTLEALEAIIADAPDLNGPGGLARRRVLAAVLGRLVPLVYRDPAGGPAARAKLQRFGRHGVRALLDLVGGSDAHADLSAVEVLGMLGRVEAVPYLARIIAPDLGPGDSISSGRPASVPGDELASVGIIALGRLGGDGARAVIETIARQGRPTLKLPVLWALGRVGGPIAVGFAKKELARAPTEASVVACLTLGRSGGTEEAAILASVAGEPGRPPAVRRAAILGLALGRHAGAVPVLSRLADSGDRDLAADARIALGTLSPGGGEARLDAPGGRDRADDARAIIGGHVDPEALLRALERR